MVGFNRATSLLLVAAAAFTSLVSAQQAASITATFTGTNGTPTTTVVAPSPTGRGYCEFYIDHWDCDPTRAEATSAASSAPSIEPSPIGQNCHLHVDHWHCDGPPSHPTAATATAAAAQASPTGQGGCHLHGDHWHCENESSSSDSHAGHDHSGHSHSGHSHGPSEEYGCGLAPLEDYNLPLHIGAVFILLAGSAFGTYLPILLYTKASGKKWGVWAQEIFFICRHFGTGVIISTAFVHLLSHAMLYWGNSCIGELKYEATGPAVAMGAVWLVFLIDFFLLRALRKRIGAGSLCNHDSQQEQFHQERSLEGGMEKRGSNSSLHRTASSDTQEGHYGGLTYAQAKLAEWDVTAIEAGIIFHSILIGVTLGVATGSGFIALLIAITFHQLFEGLALGSRLSLLEWKSTGYKLIMATAFVLTTPLGVAIGVGVRRSFNGNNGATLVVLGTFHSLSAGILLYTALVELLAGDFIHNSGLHKSSLARCIVAVVALTIGVMAMSVLALWA